MAAISSFKHHSILLGDLPLNYNPHNDLIFPCIVSTYGRVNRPRAKYYMYYAPHDAPGGICMAYCDRIEGPWNEFRRNPIIEKKWEGFFDVSHVSSPHVIWNPDVEEFFMYYHGENNTTRMASSLDGIEWDYEGRAIDTSMFDNISEASYAKVFPCEIPRLECKFIMLFMGNNEGTRRIYMAYSKDGLSWEAQPNALVSPPPETEVSQVGGPFFFPYNGRNLIVFHGDICDEGLEGLTTDIYAVDVGENFDEENHIGMFYDRTDVSEGNARSCDPFLFEAEGKHYMLSAVGPRLKQKIALAIAQ